MQERGICCHERLTVLLRTRYANCRDSAEMLTDFPMERAKFNGKKQKGRMCHVIIFFFSPTCLGLKILKTQPRKNVS